MPTWLIVFLFALGAVALFVVGMSLTLMIKGHHIDSEISTNKNMQRLGIRCAVQESREDSGQTDCATRAVRATAGRATSSPTRRENSASRGNRRGAPPGLLVFHSLQNFDRQTNHGLRRSFSL